MKAIAVLLLFFGTILVLNGYYQERIIRDSPPIVKIKYVPRSIYEEQMTSANHIMSQFRSMFEGANPLLEADAVAISPNANNGNTTSTSSTSS